MKNAQEVYNRIQETKTKIKDIKTFLLEQYRDNGEYVEIEEKMKTLREDKKRIVMAVDGRNPGEATMLEDLKIDFSTDKEMLTDIILSQVTKGNMIELQDEFKQDVLPFFSVVLKKA